MLVTAIVVPILFIIFLFISIRNRKTYANEWKQIGTIEEKEVLSGVLQRSIMEKKRFYYHYYFWHCQLFVKTNDGTTITIHYEKPALEATAPNLQKGDVLHCYGHWYGEVFLANRMDKLN